ncbi:DUF975 family protein [Peribacillus sp. SCS-26]|uniref:DUF975 family protein n=1 Tax=Paraperibacillus marinus TaxID=3115295 RepID=UPI00390583F3
MTISGIKQEAKITLKGRWGLAVLLTFLYFLITVVPSLAVEIGTAGGLDNWLYQESPTPGAQAFNIIFTLALFPLSAGYYWFFLSESRREGRPISYAFSIYKNPGLSLKIIGAYIMISIFTILWTLLLIIPGIIKGISYSQTIFILKDNPELSIFEAIRKSKKLMKGHKWKFFLLSLSFIGWGLLTIFTLGIGLLWLIPYTLTSWCVFYNRISHVHEDDHTEKEIQI